MRNHVFWAALVSIGTYGSSISATEVVKENGYELFLPHMIAADENCLTAFDAELEKAFEGVSTLTINAPHYWESYVVQGLAHIMYQDVAIGSEYGPATGTILCTLEAQTSKIREITMAFSGEGLAGHKRSPLLRTGKSLDEAYTNFITSTVR